ncbi:MAG TPA: chemotaxis protein CheB [Bryobacteraceae bacterium]|nr:chemotaxis protein CheB [Bryobacteraceae bacterium]
MANPESIGAPHQAGSGPEFAGLVVGVGASAGGLEAFSELLRYLPPETGMAFVLVQHLDPHHESILADLLANYTHMPVIQVPDDVRVEPDRVYVMPPNATMLIADGVLRLSRPAQQLSHQRRAIDAFFVSLAESMHSRAIGVVLSGAASDGTLGLKAIKAEGGITFAQDASAKFDGMPRSAIAAGYVDFVLPPKRIAEELATIAHHPMAAPTLDQLLDDLPTIDRVLGLLRKRSGVDFRLYKQPTVHRRLARRMLVRRLDTLDQYFQLLRTEPDEIDSLFDDLLIKVTSFFRDAPVFEALRETAFPALTKDRAEGDPLRVWVPGCSTGEEIYSLAMALLDFLGAAGLSFSVQLFGSDASERVIERARAGVYDDSISSAVSAERLRRYFTRGEAGYQINRNVRDLCIFSRHVLGVDPPISHMDLISCRNLLIYLAPSLQHKVIDTLAYALQPSGYLLVGSSENSGRLSELFDPLDVDRRIYCRKPSLGSRAIEAIVSVAGPPALDLPSGSPPGARAVRGDVRAIVDHMLLTRYGPSGLVVDKNLRIVEFRGDVGPYLRVPQGAVAADLIEAVREDLAVPLRSAIAEAHQRKTALRLEEIQVRQDRAFRFVRITVIPVSIPRGEPHSVILFEDLGDTFEHAGKGSVAPPPPGPGEPRERHIDHLERELVSSREHLQSIIEELRSTNEEAQAANEELQSSNEELQTTKEELQASNEELATINAEMQSRNAQLSQLNDDLANLLTSTSTPILMVGRDLRIRRFTSAAEKLLRLIPTDVGRPISDIKPRIEVPNLEEILGDVLDNLKVHEQEVRDSEGRDHLMRVRPYRTADNRIDGVVLLLTDITDLKRGMEEVRRARDYASAIVDTVREPLLVLGQELAVRGANRAFYEFFHSGPQQTEGRSVYEIADGQLDLPALRSLLERLRAGEVQLRDVEVEHEFQPLGLRTLLLNARRIKEPGADAILLAFEDVTERKRAVEARYRRLFEYARDGIVILDAVTGEVLDVNPFTEELLGHRREELVGRKFWEIEAARGTPEVRAALERIRDRGAVQFADMGFKTRDGRTIETEFIGTVYPEGDRRVIQLNVRDLTERRKFEREMQHTQKLESLGLLAGGIAHDFNNLLTGIMGNASLLYADMPPDDPARVQLRSIVRASERAADLTRQLLAYAGKGRLRTEQIGLSDLIQEILALIHTSIPRSVGVKLDLAPDLPPIEADPAQLQQLIMNVVINGAEAIGEGNTGTVQIKTGLRNLTAREIHDNFAAEALSPGSYLWLEIEDTGSGMDEATKARIFDPFFTTKFTGRGLGLAAVSGIVKANHGAIRVYSTPGRGTSFYILFPAAKNKPAARPAEPAPKPSRGSGTILVIDDESVVHEAARPMLEKSGFQVLVAESGQAAADLLQAEAGRVSLVILDLTMPGVSAEQAFDLLRGISPRVPILLASGYDEAEASARSGGRLFAGFIHKPFDLDRLLDAVNSALRPG